MGFREAAKRAASYIPDQLAEFGRNAATYSGAMKAQDISRRNAERMIGPRAPKPAPRQAPAQEATGTAVRRNVDAWNSRTRDAMRRVGGR